MARQSGGGVEAEVAVPSYSAMSLGNKKRPSGSGRLAKTATRGRLTTNHEEMKWLGGHPGRKQSRRIRSVGHAPKLFIYSSNRNARAPKRPAPSPARVRRASWANLVVDRLKSHGPVVVATASASYHVDKEELPIAPIVRCSAGWRRPYERL